MSISTIRALGIKLDPDGELSLSAFNSSKEKYIFLPEGCPGLETIKSIPLYLMSSLSINT